MHSNERKLMEYKYLGQVVPNCALLLQFFPVFCGLSILPNPLHFQAFFTSMPSKFEREIVTLIRNQFEVNFIFVEKVEFLCQFLNCNVLNNRATLQDCATG